MICGVKKEYQVIGGFGGATLDYIYHISHWPEVNQTSYINNRITVPGGMTLGALLAVSRLGGRCSFLGALGDDEEGRLLLNSMKKEGIGHKHCRMLAGEETPVSRIMIDPEGRRTIFHRRGLRDNSSLNALSEPRLEDISLLLLDGSWIKNTVTRAHEAVQRGIPVVLDLSPNNTHPLRDELIGLAGYPVLCEELCSKICGSENHEVQIRELLKRFGGTMVITAGRRGVVWGQAGGRMERIPAFKVNVLDTTGAGDTFHVAFALGVSEKMGLKETIQFAMGAAALKCTGRGQDALPDRPALNRFLSTRIPVPETIPEGDSVS